MKLPYALVTDLGQSGYGLIRGLGEAGIPTIGVHCECPWYYHSAATSKYLTEAHILPAQEDKIALEFLTDLGRKFDQKPIVLVSSDWFIKFWDRHKSELGKYFDLPISGKYNLTEIIDKNRMMEIARAAGAVTPASRSVTKETTIDNNFYSDLKFPLILKPSDIDVGTKKDMKVYHSVEELKRELSSKLEHLETLVLQEFIPGEVDSHYETHGILVEGEPFIGYMNHKLRIFPPPPAAGSTSFGETVWIDDLVDVTNNLLKEFDLRSIIHFEFKRDARDGVMKFLEVNYRSGSTVNMGTVAGINLPAIRYWAAVDPNRAHELMSKEKRLGVKWMYESGDWLLREKGIVNKEEYDQSLKGLETFALFNIEDPLPFFDALRNGSLFDSLD
ncbi:hypothetical protein B6U80_01570 [Candidatus Pacearchaeota archaeon ex4484_26]|nr:MAG: hypothetical protein B6U80_01570 [Candidatus Pacearchaeota archaeon ex4484_26]